MDDRKPETSPRGAGGPSRRRLARLAAVQALYQIDLNGSPVEPVLREFARHRLGQDIDGLVLDADSAFFVELVRGVSARKGELDTMISSSVASGRETERMEVVLRAILRCGAYELTARRDVPPRVAIKEYVDIAADFFTTKEAALANGILDRLAQQARGEELRTKPGEPDAAGG